MKKRSTLISWFSSHDFIIFLLWSLWLSLQYFCFGSASYVKFFDNGNISLPAWLSIKHLFQTHQIGLWNPLFMSGVDTISAIAKYLLDGILFFTLPGWLAYGLIMWMQRLIAGYFMFRLLRDHVHTDRLPAIFCGFSYSLFCYDSIYHQWTGFVLHDGLLLPGLPFFLWALISLTSENTRRSYFYAIALGILFFFTSHYAFSIFGMPLILLLLIVFSSNFNLSFWVKIALFFSSWMLLEIPYLWAVSLNASISHRINALTNFSGQFSLAGQIQNWIYSTTVAKGLIRDSFLQISAIVIGLLISRRKERTLYILLGLLSLLIIYYMLYGLLSGIILRHLGFLAGFNFGRVYHFFPFLVVLSCGLALLHTNEPWRLKLYKGLTPILNGSLMSSISIMFIILILIQSLLIQKKIFIELCDGSNFSNFYQNSALKDIFKHENGQTPFRVATVFGDQSYDIYPTYAWAYGLETADGYLTLYSKRYSDFWTLINFHRAKDTYNRLFLSPVKDISCQNELVFNNYYSLNLLSLANVNYLISSLPLKDDNLSLVTNPLLAEQLAWKDRPRRDKFLGLLSTVYPGTPVYVYENRNVLPRFFFTVKSTIFDDSEKLLQALANTSVKDLRESAFVNRIDILHLPPMQGVQKTKSGRVVLVRYTSDSIILDVESDSEGVLVATNNFSPFWKAWVDNRETKIFPVYHTFQGMFIEKGHHRVDLKYNPPYSVNILKLFE